MKVTYFVGILWLVQWIAGVSTTGHGNPPSCCMKTSKTRVNVDNIRSYSVQNDSICPIKAVRFHLINMTICSDPEDIWAKHAIKKLNRTIINKRPNTPTKWTSTNRTESISSTSTESKPTMTTPKETSTAWKPGTSIPHRSPPSGNAEKPSQWTATQMMPTKVTATADRKPLTTDIKKTSMTLTTEIPVVMTTPEGTLTIREAGTNIPHRSQPSGNTEKPLQRTATQMTAKKMTTTTERKPLKTNIKTTSMTMRTEIPVIPTTPEETSTTRKPTKYNTLRPPLLGNADNLSQWTTPKFTSTTMDRKPLTTKIRVTTKTTPKGTSTMEKTVQKRLTTSVKPRKTRCPPSVTTKQDKAKDKKIPWTVRRLRKKSKKGLKRVQMKSWRDPGCTED